MPEGIKIPASSSLQLGLQNTGTNNIYKKSGNATPVPALLCKLG